MKATAIPAANWGADVIAGIVGAIAQSVINATVDKQGKAAAGSGRACTG